MADGSEIVVTKIAQREQQIPGVVVGPPTGLVGLVVQGNIPDAGEEYGNLLLRQKVLGHTHHIILGPVEDI